MTTWWASERAAARKAVDLFVYRIGRELGSLAAALGGLDALVFTAGIGEHSAEIRANVCRGARWLGITLDEEANTRGGPRLLSPRSAISAWGPTNPENPMISRAKRAPVAGRESRGSLPFFRTRQK